MEDRPLPQRRGGLLFPLLLIAMGTLFLLNNLGIVSWTVWRVIGQMWPVLLIAIGLDILLRGYLGTGARATMVSLLIMVVVLGAAGAAAIAVPAGTILGRELGGPHPWEGIGRIQIPRSRSTVASEHYLAGGASTLMRLLCRSSGDTMRLPRATVIPSSCGRCGSRGFGRPVRGCPERPVCPPPHRLPVQGR